MFKISGHLFITDFYRLFKKVGLNSEVTNLFQKIIYEYYIKNKRKFPFREKISPYNVLVSEIMLQQTQTRRVSEKFLKFINTFPDFLSLSNASFEEVLKQWKGLGYNRRAVALKKIAEIVINEHKGKLPDSLETLKSFPQIGHNTASSIVTFAFNKPTVFIETNIRRVYIYFFFYNKSQINDREILSIVEKTVDKINPREWYYALMDYGVMLKKTHPGLNKKSVHYRKQAPFKGSTRQTRGSILEILIKQGTIDIVNLQQTLKINDKKKIHYTLNQLEKEGFIEIKEEMIFLKK